MGDENVGQLVHGQRVDAQSVGSGGAANDARAAHDGAATLAPRWERYGQTPYRPVEESNAFTLELGIQRKFTPSD